MAVISAAAAQEADAETKALLTRTSRLAKSAGSSEPPFRSSPFDRPRANYFMSDSGPDTYAKLLEDLENASLQDQWHEPHRPM